MGGLHNLLLASSFSLFLCEHLFADYKDIFKIIVALQLALYCTVKTKKDGNFFTYFDVVPWTHFWGKVLDAALCNNAISSQGGPVTPRPSRMQGRTSVGSFALALGIFEGVFCNTVEQVSTNYIRVEGCSCLSRDTGEWPEITLEKFTVTLAKVTFKHQAFSPKLSRLSSFMSCSTRESSPRGLQNSMVQSTYLLTWKLWLWEKKVFRVNCVT